MIDEGPWAPGSVVLHRFGRLGRTGFLHAGRVLADDGEGLVFWIGGGYPTVGQQLLDGRHVRAIPVEERAHSLRMTAHGRWRGDGIVRWVPPPEPDGTRPHFTVWWFFDGTGSFTGWYGNLELPARRHRTPGGTQLVDSQDLALDLVVAPDGTSVWKDEDEFAAYAGSPGRWTVEEMPAIRAQGDRLRARAASGLFPFDGRWIDVVPPADWTTPDLPADWDEPHLGCLRGGA